MPGEIIALNERLFKIKSECKKTKLARRIVACSATIHTAIANC